MSSRSFHARMATLLLGSLIGCGAAPITGAIPVTVQAARRQDVPVYASGLGTVTPLNSALVRPRVDGTLDSVAFTEGQEVKQGDLLAIIDPRPYLAVLDQARAKRAQDAATFGNAQHDLARYTTLARSGFASRQTADTQSATVSGGQALLQADDAAIEAAALNVAFTHITAPIAGRVGLRQINPGNLVHAVDAAGIVTVTQLHPIGVLFTLPEESVSAIAAAQAAGQVPQVQAFDTEGGRVLASGTLLTADNTINTSTGTIQLKAVFDNADNPLWPGQFVQARLLLRTLKQVVSVPARAVQRGQDGLFVYVARADGVAEQRPVREFQEQDGTAAIESGLRGDERVVVDGQSRVSDGAKLSVHEVTS